MLPIKKVLLLSTCLVLLFITTNVFAKKKSYVMVCKGGGNMGMRVANAKYASIKLYFTKSKYAGTARTPNPGECAWMDRPISHKEPRFLTYIEHSNPVSKIRIFKSKILLDFSPKPYGKLAKSVYNGDKFFLHVKNNGRSFIITKIGI